MNAPVIDAVAVTTPQSTTSTKEETKAADFLTFQIGMLIVGAVVLVMTVVGLISASVPLLIASGLLAVVATLAGVYTGVNLLAR